MPTRIKQNPLLLPFITLGVFSLSVFLISIGVGFSLFIRYLIFVFIVTFVIVASLATYFTGKSRYIYKDSDWDNIKPYEPKYDKQKWNILLNTHQHTLYSDGKLTVEQAVRYNKAMGFNACVFTDHNNMNNLKDVLDAKERHKNDFVVIPGIEWTTGRVHLCFLGITEWKENIPWKPTNEEIKKAVDQVHQMGGVVVVCHFPWSMGGSKPRIPDHPSRQEMYDIGVDLIECANWDDDISLVDLDSYDFAKDPNHSHISPCTGCDMHTPEKDPLCGWTLVHADAFNEEAIMKELRNHRTDAILIPNGLPYFVKHGERLIYKILKPLYNFGNMFVQSVHKGGPVSNLDGNMISLDIIYIEIIFGLMEILGFLFNANLFSNL
jgi:hypothetical protein